MTKDNVSRSELEQQILKRCSEDAAFRRLLLQDPKQALHKAFGLEFPPEVELHTLEETATKLYIVLPIDRELMTDSDLEKIAGGAVHQLRKKY